MPRSDLEVAHALADAAAPIAESYFYSRGPLGVRSKADDSPVSDADVAVERELRSLLARYRPDDPIVGEELGGEPGPGRRWVIDPIDGTRSYVRHLPTWCTLIALLVDGVPQVGVVSAPALSRRWWAERGAGAWTRFGDRPATRCRASDVADVGEALVLYTELPMDGDGALDAGFAGLVRRSAMVRGFDGFWAYMLVAEGVADVALDDNPRLALWDVAAQSVIVEEAGGRFAHADGGALPRGGPAVCSNGHLLAEALSALQVRAGDRMSGVTGPGR